MHDDPMQILVDALYMREMEWKDILFITAGLSDPMGQLDMAEWVVDHPTATLQEMVAEGNQLIKKYQF